MTVTDWVILAGVLLIAVSDVILLVTHNKTISNRFRYYAKNISFSAYAWGSLGGHFFGPHLEPAFGNWWASIGCLVGIMLVLALNHWFILSRYLERCLFDGFSLLYFIIGIPCGIFFWPQ